MKTGVTDGPAKRRIKLEDGTYVSFFWIESAVVEHLYKASPAAWVVYLVICKYARNTTQESYPSIQTMADLIGCSPNTVRKGVRELEQSKLISVRQTGKPGREHNVYRLLPAAKIRRSTPSGIEGAGSKFEGAPSKSAHELEEVELEELNEKESKTKHGPAGAGDEVSNSSLEGKTLPDLTGFLYQVEC
jgi:transposase-like protein